MGSELIPGADDDKLKCVKYKKWRILIKIDKSHRSYGDKIIKVINYIEPIIIIIIIMIMIITIIHFPWQRQLIYHSNRTKNTTQNYNNEDKIL